VWDEASGTWMFRHGYQKANNDSKEWPIMEVKASEDPYEDPWERQREAKRERSNKNTESRMRNEERAGKLSKGTTTRFLKSAERTRQAGKAGGNHDRDNGLPRQLPAGVPVDLRPTKSSGELNPSKRGKSSTVAALIATQRSTASLGKFDKMLEGEPERKKVAVGAKKRKYESSTDKKVISTESERSMKLFKAVIDGGGAAKEKDRKKGRLAKGETAYDYDYDDGLGPSTFRKKKGRAGAGKMKKMTKKRAK
jgi:regulator of ribosome biosynthesis